MGIPHVDVKAQYAPLLEELKQRLAAVLDSGQFILGPEVRAFEEESADFLGVRDAVGVANGTDALVLVLEALGVGRGRRGHLPGLHVLCDRRGRFARRRDAGLLRHRPDHASTSTPRTSLPGSPREPRRSSPSTSSGDRRRSPRCPRVCRSSRTPLRPSARVSATGVPARSGWQARSASSRPRTCSASATAASSSRTIPSWPAVSGSCASTAPRTRSVSMPSASTRGWTRSRRRRSASSLVTSTGGTLLAGMRRRAMRSSAWLELCELPEDEPGHVYHMYVGALAGARPNRRGIARRGDRLRDLLHDATPPTAGLCGARLPAR